MTKVTDAFGSLAHRASQQTGKPSSFIVAIAIVVVWGLVGPLFHYSDTWQLVINTGTTIITFLMVFLVQATQNRDTAAVHLKLDELIRVTRAARNTMIAIEDATDAYLAAIKREIEAKRKE
jgi:low affinity Fe/Cu permease